MVNRDGKVNYSTGLFSLFIIIIVVIIIIIIVYLFIHSFLVDDKKRCIPGIVPSSYKVILII